MVAAALGPSITNLFKVFGPTAGAAGIGAGLGLGAGAGGAASQIGLLPFNGANNFVGSAYFGYGMILGERYAYQNDWPKIQKRLEGGENIMNIMQEYTGTFTAVVMEEARLIFASLTKGLTDMMSAAINGQVELGGGGPSPTSNLQDARDERVGATQINIDGEPFIEAGSQQAKDIGATGFERLRETVGQKQAEQVIKPFVKQVNAAAEKIAFRTPTQNAQVPWATGSAIFGRNDLIQKIAAKGVEVSRARDGVNAFRGSKNPGAIASKQRNLDDRVKELGQLQVKLGNLLAKYNWTRLTS